MSATTVAMRYFQSGGQTFGYDPTQTALIDAAVAAAWTEVTGAWPPAPDPPTLLQQAVTAMQTGLTLTLSGSISLPATLFPVDTVTQAKLAAVMTTLLKTGAFPSGGSAYPMKDSTAVWHSFTVSQYEAVASAISTYVAALDLIIDGNPLGATALPANAVSLTV